MTTAPVVAADQGRALWLSTFAFTICFAVWTIFAIIGIQIQKDLGLTDTQFGLLVGTPILVGSLIRLILGVWADQYGGRVVLVITMLAAAAMTALLTFAHDYPTFLLAALGVGLSGGSFSVGVAYVAKWFPKEKQGTALGIFGAGNVGAAVTKFAAPTIMVAYGWQMVALVWAAALAITAVLFFLFTKDDPDLARRRAAGTRPESLGAMLAPLANLQVWRFSLYYFFVFGGFVALALWLPRYLIGVYGLDIKTAGMIGAFYSIPASVFRAYGGHLSDRYGARRVMYWSLLVGVACTFILSYPPTHYTMQGIRGPVEFSAGLSIAGFMVVAFVLGFFMSLGKAAVYKHIPVYYPDRVGAVGGMVGLVGGLGGFLLPIAFGALNDLTGVWQSCFWLLFLVVGAAVLWMHFAVRNMERNAAAAGIPAHTLPELPEMQPIHGPAQQKALAASGAIEDWRPEAPDFWASTGRRIARRNLWISVPCLLLSFAIWMVWSVVVAKLPAAGFRFSNEQLFWLAALPGLSGATLRVFYSFMPAMFGGRLWTTLTTWSLLIPALGIGFAVQEAGTPYWIFLALAMLCGLGGGNFASSMANISYFFPKAEKGGALAINAGLGNLGVSVVQFVVPLVITAGVFGWLGGDPQVAGQGGASALLWLQNAGFVFVPFIVASAIAAWFGMDDIATMKASFADQSVIFRRSHNWIMCWLYTGTFGSFIGFSAAFPLLTKILFPEVNALSYAFLGPLVGALARAVAGKPSDRFGGGRLTLWVFVAMSLGTLGILYAIGMKGSPTAFPVFFASFLFLFAASGVGNASTFQMIPAIMRKEVARLHPALSAGDLVKQSDKESAAIIGFTSAVAAYGAFFIPKSFGTSIAATGGAEMALYGFLGFYMSCIAMTWWFYTRRGGLLHDVECRGTKGSAKALPAE
ncbi:MFS transporter, NNP family, nitrate/nitrite transporter [Roseomonas rosea]|uniref:MFS transporter, NNP family, nitrate/nitrite transporter n=1 Tax=Muricoccus roseus TaxID=198092 RepID=A0A1M6N567_9PROT|nr:MFS transporter [Roseomonas rosea]SHJ90776.1 MFS transporter, NNP family, nitrate/nitrite transporter [Roseomonas rosea]